LSGDEQLSRTHQQWVDEAIAGHQLQRRPEWTKAIAVGSREFAVQIRDSLASRAGSRQIINAGEGYELREPEISYNANFDGEIDPLSSQYPDL